MRYTFVLVATLWLGLGAQPAFAYIDPGSGSAIMSAVIGFLVAVSMAIKTYWYKLKSFFFGSKDAENKNDIDVKDEPPST
jgi:hypothetical protein